MGAEGGRETLKRHGIDHFRDLGRKGFNSLVNRYFGGDRTEATDWLRKKAHDRHINALADKQLDAELAAGAEVASIELPVVFDVDDDHTYHEPWTEKVPKKPRGRLRA